MLHYHELDALLRAWPVLLLHGPAATAGQRVLELVLDREGCTGVGEVALVQAGNHPDCQLHDGRDFSTEAARELCSSTTTLPIRWSRKYYIISYIDRIHVAALTAFLKPLEEPTAHIAFLLTTDAPERVPATILSRVWPVRLGFGAVGEVERWLEGRGVADREVRARWGDGDLEQAVQLEVDLVREWQQVWAGLGVGGVVAGDFLAVWTERLLGANEASQRAAWRVVGASVVPVLGEARWAREVATVAWRAREEVERGLANKLQIQTALCRVFAILKNRPAP